MYEIRTRDTDVLILCGGHGTRFRAVSQDIPKALAPIQGQPFIDLLLDDLVSQCFQRIILAIGHLGEQIEAHVEQRRDVEYLISREEQPLGTGGAIRHALSLMQSENVLVMNGDSHIAFSIKELLEFHKTKRAEVTVLLSSATQGTDYGNVELENNERVVTFHEKPTKSFSSLINAGVYLIESTLIQQQLAGPASIEKEWLPRWAEETRVFGIVTSNPVYDIGTLERFQIAQQHL